MHRCLIDRSRNFKQFIELSPKFGDYYAHYHTTFYNIFSNKEGSGGLSFRIGVSF